MRLRKPCNHKSDAYPEGHYEPHLLSLLFSAEGVPDRTDCSGGEFLPEGALVVEKVDGEWPESARDALRAVLWNTTKDYSFNSILDALASQVRESK